MTAEAVALDGRPLGKRGAATRRRLLDATARLLESHGVRDLRVVDIAREVGTPPATWSTPSSGTGTGTGPCSAPATSPRRKATCASARCATTRCGRSPTTS